MNWQIKNPGLTTDRNMTTDQIEFLRRDQNAVMHSVIKSFRQIIPQNPPLGLRPLCIFKHEEPITDSTSDINYYRIGLSTTDRYYSQIVYQFAHEFCHVYADPRITNWFIESICEMMSQYALDCLSRMWARSPLPMSRDSMTRKCYAHSFKDYLDELLSKVHIAMIGIDAQNIDRKTQLGWLRSNMSDLSEPLNRDRNKIIAELSRSIFELERGSWQIIPFLGKASSPYPATLLEYRENSEFSFDKLHEVVPKNAKNTVQELRNVLSM